MNLVGWNVLPDNCSVEFIFEEGPTWLKVLALTPFLDRFAYPIAVKRGLGFLWSSTLSEEEILELESWGWNIYLRVKNNEERFQEGSIARLTTSARKRHFPAIAFTRWGHQRAMRNYVHKRNGTYSNLRNGTTPFKL